MGHHVDARPLAYSLERLQLAQDIWLDRRVEPENIEIVGVYCIHSIQLLVDLYYFVGVLVCLRKISLIVGNQTSAQIMVFESLAEAGNLRSVKRVQLGCVLMRVNKTLFLKETWVGSPIYQPNRLGSSGNNFILSVVSADYQFVFWVAPWYLALIILVLLAPYVRTLALLSIWLR